MLAPKVTEIFRERMIAGFLLSTDPDHALELKEKFDEDRKPAAALLPLPLPLPPLSSYTPNAYRPVCHSSRDSSHLLHSLPPALFILLHSLSSYR
jgi:hypothetical protein